MKCLFSQSSKFTYGIQHGCQSQRIALQGWIWQFGGQQAFALFVTQIVYKKLEIVMKTETMHRFCQAQFTV